MSACDHSESLYGRCTSCGMTWEQQSMKYRIVPGVFARPLDAVAPRRAELVDAVADMGSGIVIDSTGAVVAFHESHLRFIEAGVGDYRVSPHPSPANQSGI